MSKFASAFTRILPARPAALLSLAVGAVLISGCASSVSGDAGTQSRQQAPNPPSVQTSGGVTDSPGTDQQTDQPGTGEQTTEQQTTEPQTTEQQTSSAPVNTPTTAKPPKTTADQITTSTSTRPVVRTTVVHTATVTAEQPTQGAGGEVLQLDHFSSPSGNISCLIATDTEPQVRCDLAESTIPKNHDCHGTGDWGVSVTLVAGQKAEMRCISDTVMQPGIPALAYGQQTKVGDITCKSAEDGMHCSDPSGHGFRLAKASYDVS